MDVKIVTDQLNRSIKIPNIPKRIISLVPSQTEYLYSLGLDEEIVGQTIFCIHPSHKHKTKTIIGGTKNLKLDAIAQLKPDLIIGNKEENDQQQINYLIQHHTVWMSDIYTLYDAYEMMDKIGEVVNKQEEAQQLVNEIKNKFLQFQNTQNAVALKTRVAYFIWRNPFMVAAQNTFINHLLELLNFENVFVIKSGRYPIINQEEIAIYNPQIVFLSSEPYSFNGKHIAELQNLLPQAKIILVDGEMFSWYGSRLQYSAAYFSNLLEQIKI